MFAPTAAEPTAQPREMYVPLVTLTYTSAVPRPHAACTDPTPDEQIQVALQAREEQLRQKEHENMTKEAAKATATPPAAPAASDAAGEQAAPAAAGSGAQGLAAEAAQSASAAVQQLKEGAAGAIDGVRSLISHLSLTVEKASNDVTVKAHTQARALDQQQSYDRFSSYFGADLVKGQGEVLLADYSCSAMHNGGKVDGHLFITRNYLCFAANFGSVFASAADALRQAVKKVDNDRTEEPAKVVGVKQVIPLRSIASIVRSVTLPTVDNGVPYFLPCPTDTVVATALQIYDKDENKLYQFLNFDSMVSKAGSVLTSALKGTPLDRAYNYLDHAWREAATVPLEGVQYA